MANLFAPNGFLQISGTGSAPTYEQSTLAIASTNTTPIFSGDPVAQAVNSTGVGTGYITQAAPVQALAISGFTLNNGIVTATFTSTIAPAVGASLVLSGLTTATTLNGTWTIASATTTTVTFAYSGAAITTQATTGYVYTPVAGIFIGCRYLSVAQKRPVWSNYYPGSDANGDVQAFVITDPDVQLSVMTGNSNTAASPFTFANVGQNIGFNWSQSGVASVNGNTANGLSTYFVDAFTAGSNAALPFRVIGLQNYLPGVVFPLASINGYDPTTAYNRIVVGFNNALPNRPSAGI